MEQYNSMTRKNCFLNGQLLIAMPGMSDGHFTRTVVYICAHSREGAMGIVLNQLQTVILPDLLQQLGVIGDVDAIHLPRSVRMLKVRNGGPVEQARGFVLHSDDYVCESTVHITEGICLTATVDVLHALSKGFGPTYALVALGYAGWGPGQLEAEINANDWLTGPATQAILFDGETTSQYDRCLAQIGVDPMRLIRQAGHA